MNQFKWLLVLTSITFFFANSAYPQSNGASGKGDDLYSMALVASITEMQKSWGYIDDGENGSRLRTDYNHLIVRQYPEITQQLPREFGAHHIEYLDDHALIDRYKTLGKEFSVLEVHAIHNEGPRLKINISVSWIGYKHGRLSLGISDWSEVEFVYDREKNIYIISDVKLGGI